MPLYLKKKNYCCHFTSLLSCDLSVRFGRSLLQMKLLPLYLIKDKKKKTTTTLLVYLAVTSLSGSGGLWSIGSSSTHSDLLSVPTV
jgi:hypothetical protein